MKSNLASPRAPSSSADAPKDRRSKDTPAPASATATLAVPHVASPSASPSSSPLPSPRMSERPMPTPQKPTTKSPRQDPRITSPPSGERVTSPKRRERRAPKHNDSASSINSESSSSSAHSLVDNMYDLWSFSSNSYFKSASSTAVTAAAPPAPVPASHSASAVSTPTPTATLPPPPAVAERAPSLVGWTDMLATAPPVGGEGKSREGSAEQEPVRIEIDKLSPAALYDLATEEVARAGDSAITASLYRLAAEKGHLDAQAKIAVVLYEGRGNVSKNTKEAIEWYKRAVLGGQSDAQCGLGMLYLDGAKPDLAVNHLEGIRLIRCSADQGNAAAAFALGMCFATAKGVEKDYLSALQWFNRAAEKDHAEALYWLGLMYEKGKGYKKSHQEAVKCYTRAQNLGNVLARNRLLRLVGKMNV